MAAEQNKTTHATTALAQLDLSSNTAENEPGTPEITFVDTTQKLALLISTLHHPSNVDKPVGIMFQALSGNRLGKRIAFLNIWNSNQTEGFVVDVHTLRAAAFDYKNRRGQTLRGFLESEAIKKYCFDVGTDSKVLFKRYEIRLAGVIDVQILEFASRQGGDMRMRSFEHCLRERLEQGTSEGRILIERQQSKDAVGHLIDSFPCKSNARRWIKLWAQRPLPPVLISSCLRDVRHLSLLANKFTRLLGPGGLTRAAEATRMRLELSRCPESEPTSDEYVHCPEIAGLKRWRKGKEKRKAEKEKEFSERKALSAGQEYLQLEQQVTADDELHCTTSAKATKMTSSTRCNEECGWCGYCADDQGYWDSVDKLQRRFM